MKQVNSMYSMASDHYITADQLEMFRNQLAQWKLRLNDSIEVLKDELRENRVNVSELTDAVTLRSKINKNLDDLARHKKTLTQIDKALQRIASRQYGYCEVTGEEIGLKRLQAMPLASLSIGAQKVLEIVER